MLTALTGFFWIFLANKYFTDQTCFHLFGTDHFTPPESEEEETCLPQDPKANAVSRKKQLAAKQKNYTWRMGVRNRCCDDQIGTKIMK